MIVFVRGTQCVWRSGVLLVFGNKTMPSKEVIKFLCQLPSHLDFCIHQAPEEILAARVLILIGELSRVYKY